MKSATFTTKKNQFIAGVYFAICLIGLCVEPASDNFSMKSFVIYYLVVIANMALAVYLIHKSFSKNVTSNTNNRNRV